MKIDQLICLPKFDINNIEYNNNTLKIFVSFKSKRSQCPVCGIFSASVHDSYTRTISDLPACLSKYNHYHFKNEKF